MNTSPQARVALAKRLWQFAHTNPSELTEEMKFDDWAAQIVQTALSLYIQRVREVSNIPEEVTLPVFLERLEPPLVMDLSEIAVSSVPDQIQEQFGPGANRAWSYVLSRGDKQVSGHFLAARNVIGEPIVRTIVQDMLVGDNIGDDLMSAQDTQHLCTLFTEDELEALRSMGWE